MKQDVLSGIILRSDKHRENDARLSLITGEGIVVAYAVGLLKPNSKLKSCLQPFNLVEITLTGTKITGATLIASGLDIAKDINRYYLACGISSAILTVCGRADEGIYELAVRCFVLLSKTKVSAYKIYIHFYAKLIGILGYGMHGNPKLDVLRDASAEELDKVSLTLATAKECISILQRAYVEHLDYKLEGFCHVDVY